MSVIYDSEGNEQTIRLSNLAVTATGAVNAGVTLTLPLVAGKFHYINHIEIVKYYSVVGVAGAPVVVTTTNLPGSVAFTFDQSLSPAGTCSVRQLSPCSSIRSLAVGVNTTIVCPAQLQTIWRVTVFYSVGL